MSRLRKIVLWVAGILVGLPLALLGLTIIILNLAPAQAFVAQETNRVTGGMITVEGLHGRFPDALRVGRLAIADARGQWLAADDIVLDWSPTALVGLVLKINDASIHHLTVSRMPMANVHATQGSPPSTGPARLPIGIALARLHIDRADIGMTVVGTSFSASLNAVGNIRTLQRGTFSMDISRLDRTGTYHADTNLSAAGISARVRVHEPVGGLIAAIAKLPAIGAIDAEIDVAGPRSAEQAHFDLQAGPLHAALAGTANIPDRQIAVDIDATAPAMHPAATVAWEAIDLHGHVRGVVEAPTATGHLAITDLSVGGTQLSSVTANLVGSQQDAQLRATINIARIPGRKPDLLSGAPVEVTADANLVAPDRPVQIELTHPLLRLNASAQTRGLLGAQAHLLLPNLAPLATAGGANVEGSADLTARLADLNNARRIIVTGAVNVDGGQQPLPGLLGKANLNIALRQANNDITLDQATLDGKSIHLNAGGTKIAQTLSIHWTAALTDLNVLLPQLRGAVTAQGAVDGRLGQLAANMNIKGQAGTSHFPNGPVSVAVQVENLPNSPAAKLQGTVRLQEADAIIGAHASTGSDGVLHAVLDRAKWKSIALHADVAIKQGAQPTGSLNLAAGNLADLAPFSGQQLGGAIDANLAATGGDATVAIDGKEISVGTRRVGLLAISGRATGLNSDPLVNADLRLDGIQAEQLSGKLKVTADGRTSALQLRGEADLENLENAPATVAVSALMNMPAHQAKLQTLTADWKTLVLHLSEPATFAFGSEVSVDHFNLTLNDAKLQARGRFVPDLQLTASVRDVTPELAQPFFPQLSAVGVLSANASISGQPAAPSGTVHLGISNLRMKTGPAASVPPASIIASTVLMGGSAHIDAHLDAGPKLHLVADGIVPLQPQLPLALHTFGTFDLTLLDPVLTAAGRRASGTAKMNLSADGTLQAPRIIGEVSLANGVIQDFGQGLRLDGITTDVAATGTDFVVRRFNAHAGGGSISLTGTVGATAPGIPIDFHISAQRARPIASDLLTATFDTDITLQGQALGNMDAKGRVLLRRMDINIPDNLPPSVVVLKVRRPGERVGPLPGPRDGSPPPAAMRLSIDVDAPSNIFVRGKGLYAELGGKLKVAGTSSAPQILGGFDMRRGDFALAGTSLTFSKGAVSFNGEGVTGRIDPTLDFEADSFQGGITATLKVNGYADAPKIALSSVPDLPQDEVLAHLLFGVSMKDLTPLQIAEIGAALAELSGAVGSEGPLGSIRKGLGLDRLSVGGGSGGAGASVEAGRYVAKGVYVGTKQSTSGAGGTQVEVQIDLTRRLKLKSTLASGGASAQGATPDNDPGTSVGLSYQFEY